MSPVDELHQWAVLRTSTVPDTRPFDCYVEFDAARRRSSSNWMELEDTAALGRFHRMVEIDPIDDANEPDTERHASRVRTEDVAKEANSLCRVQLGRAHFFFPAAHRDGRAAGKRADCTPIGPRPRAPRPNACLRPR